MAIERFPEVLGTPNQPKPVSVKTAESNKPEPISKPDNQAKKRNERLEKVIKEASDRILQLEEDIKSLHNGINQSGSDTEVTLTRLSGIESELQNIRSIKQELTI